MIDERDNWLEGQKGGTQTGHDALHGEQETIPRLHQVLLTLVALAPDQVSLDGGRVKIGRKKEWQ